MKKKLIEEFMKADWQFIWLLYMMTTVGLIVLRVELIIIEAVLPADYSWTEVFVNCILASIK